MGKIKMSVMCSVICLLCVSLVSACTTTSQPVDDQSLSFEGLDSLFTDIYEDGVYKFEGFSWFTPQEEIMKNESGEEREIGKIDEWMTEGSLDLDDSIDQQLVYSFQNNELVSGQYLFSMKNEVEFTSFSNSLKKLLADQLPEPEGNDLTVLDEAGTVAFGGRSVRWEGEDRSTLKVNVLLTEDEGESVYLLQIQTNAPRSTQNSASNDQLSQLMDNIGEVKEDVFENLELEEGQNIDSHDSGLYIYHEEQLFHDQRFNLLLTFDVNNDKLYGFEFINNFEDFDQDGYDLALRLFEEFNEMHGEPTTYPGLERISTMPDYEDLSILRGKQFQESWKVNEELDVTLRMYIIPSDEMINVAVQYKVNPENW